MAHTWGTPASGCHAGVTCATSPRSMEPAGRCVGRSAATSGGMCSSSSSSPLRTSGSEWKRSSIRSPVTKLAIAARLMPVMVGHVRAHEGRPPSGSPAGVEVDGLVEAERAERAERLERLQVPNHLTWANGERQHARVRSHDDILLQTAAHSQGRHAERAVLVLLEPVQERVSALGDSPRSTHRPSHTRSDGRPRPRSSR
jgi:hypothetical protein